MSKSYFYIQATILSTPVCMLASEQGLMYVNLDNHDEKQLFAQFKKLFNINQDQCKRSVLPFKHVIEEVRRFEQGESIQCERLKLDLRGTSFQIRVWQSLLHIPFGHTTYYGDIAQKINNVKASRAVGRAIGANPILLIVPCHRVIGKNGALTGFSAGLELKQRWLEHERINLNL